MTKLRHFDNLGTARFVTFSCHRRQAYLTIPEAAELLSRHLSLARTKYRFKLLAYVFMPEHVHLVLLPPDGMKLGLVIREIKSKMARDYFASGHGELATGRVFWMKRCYDHNCRTQSTIMEKINYCHLNPVRRCLVSMPEDWRWSSYRWYLGERRSNCHG